MRMDINYVVILRFCMCTLSNTESTADGNEVTVISTFWRKKKKKKNWKIKIASSQSYLSTFNHATSVNKSFIVRCYHQRVKS
jgi:hypothetical protein